MRKQLALVPEPEVELDEIGLPMDELGNLTPNGRPRCKGLKPDGTRCRAFQGRTGYCFHHDDRLTDKDRYRARQKGGQHSSKIARAEKMLPPRLRNVFQRLDQAMIDVVEGTLPPTRASALASLASASVRVLEAGEIEERLRDMERVASDDTLTDDDLDEILDEAGAADEDLS